MALDFASSLMTGPLAQSDLGKVFKKANQAKNADFVSFDEIGLTANAFDKMLLKFHNSIQEVSHTVHYFTNATNILKERSDESNFQ